MAQVISRNIAIRMTMLEEHCAGFSVAAVLLATGWTRQNWTRHIRGDGAKRSSTIDKIAWLLAMPPSMLQYGTAGEVAATDMPLNANWLRAYDEDKCDWLAFRATTGIQMTTPSS